MFISERSSRAPALGCGLVELSSSRVADRSAAANLRDDIDFVGDCVFATRRDIVTCRHSGVGASNTGRYDLNTIAVEEAVHAADDTGCRVTLR
jgi:hypothetical protein